MFKEILNVKPLKFKDSFGNDQQCVIVRVIMNQDESIQEYVIYIYGTFVHHWPLGTPTTHSEAEGIKTLLRGYDIHKAACDLGSV